LLAPGRLALPPVGFQIGQAVAGVALGTLIQGSTLTGLGTRWIPVVLVSLATLAVTVGAGMLLARVTRLDRPTASLGMVAGGASGIVAMAGDLGADDRLVAFMQYARVLVVVLLTPVLIPLFFPGHHGGSVVTAHESLLGDASDWLLTAAIAVGGGLAARALRIPAGALLGPMIVAGVLTLGSITPHLAVPALLREIGFAVIGLQVGLRFTVATVRQVGRLLVPVLISIVALLVACFGLAVALAATTPVSLLDAYLATTPGGLYAVLAVAFGAGANTTFIIAVQGLRVLVMVLLAPVAVRRLIGHPAAVQP
jgi:membrane AbrB-like protein